MGVARRLSNNQVVVQQQPSSCPTTTSYFRFKMPEVESTVNLENTRKSSLITVGKTTGQRKKSFVSFEEKSETIEVIKVEEEEDKEREDDNDEEEEGGDVLSRLRSEKEGVKGDNDDEEEEEEEEVVAYTRRWTDSLKINRKKSKQEQ